MALGAKPPRTTLCTTLRTSQLESKPMRKTSESPQQIGRSAVGMESFQKRRDTSAAGLGLHKEPSSSLEKGSFLNSSAPRLLALSDLEMDKELGKGSYAIVKLAKHKLSREELAVKIYEKTKLLDPLKKRSVDREISILQKLKHPHIIRYVAHIETKIQLYLVMEYLGHRSLYEHVKSQPKRRLSESECKQVLKQIASAIHYLHVKDVAHRDLKLENILFVKDAGVKLIDFGFAVKSKEKQRTFCGTPTYMAPEIIKRLPYNGSDVDIWAVGIMTYRMLTGTYPFMANNDKELYKKIIHGGFDTNYITSHQAKDLISRMLRVNPEERIKAQEIVAHEWLQEK